uniref:TLDc domain-containing protein n=1 Tax=Globodera pallida TaxID=36090 RepID=A0A183C785_GLOPA
MDKTNGNDSNFHQQQTGQFFHNNLSRYRFNHHPFLPSLAQQQMVLMMSSESEENSGGGGSGSATASVGSKTTDHQHRLQKQNSNTSSSNTTFVSSSSSNNTVYSSMFSSSRLLDDEDPVFSLDEEVLAKAQSNERTRHYTADFDPTVSDDDVDDLARDAGKLHGGRAFSATHRFPPRTRHSGRSGRGGGAGVGGCGGFPSLERVVGSLSEEEESGGGGIAGGAGQTVPSLPQAQQMVLMMSSESEENSGGGGSGSATASVGSKTTDHQHRLQKQNSNTSSSNTTFVSSSSSNNTVYSSMFSSSRLLDDEDPVFSLDEEVLAKAQSNERTRHYTADFDPTVSDDDVDDLARDAGKLHGGRAFSATHRFPPRTRHSGRSAIHTPAVVGIANMHTAAAVGGHGHSHHRTVVPASLPIAISRGGGAGVGGCGGFPSLERVVGSLSEEEESGGGGIAGGAGQTVPSLPQAVPPTTTAGERLAKANKQPKMAMDHALVPYLLAGRAERKQRAGGSEREEGDLFGRIQAYSRSIQPADDPERLFGERPRRHQHNHSNNTKQQLENNSSVVEGENIPPPPSIAAAAAVGDCGVSRNNSDGRHGVCGGGVVVAAGNVTTTTTAGTAAAAVMLDNNNGGGAGAGGMGAPATTTAVTTASAGGVAAAGEGARAVVGTPRIIVPTSLRAVW